MEGGLFVGCIIMGVVVMSAAFFLRVGRWFDFGRWRMYDKVRRGRVFGCC